MKYKFQLKGAKFVGQQADFQLLKKSLLRVVNYSFLNAVIFEKRRGGATRVSFIEKYCAILAYIWNWGSFVLLK
jgi:hypothetical protein